MTRGRPNLARLNHILIPTRYADRRRVQRRWYVRLFRPAIAVYLGLSDEGRALVVIAFIAAVLGLDTLTTEAHLLWAAATGALGISFALRPAWRLRALRLSIDHPPRVTRGQPIAFTLTLHNEDTRACHALRASRPFPPWDGRWIGRPPGLDTLEPGQRGTVTAHGVFSARGAHHLGPFDVSSLVPLGLAAGPRVSTRDTHFLVLPPVAEVSHVRIPASRRHQPGGVALASRTGESMELKGVRPYRRGDPVRDLHARTWARTGQPMVREYVEEYFSRIGLVLDTDHRRVDEATLESAISLAAGVVAWLTRGESLIDLLVVGEDVHPLMLGRSLGHMEQALDLLAVVEPGPELSAERLGTLLEPHLGRLSAAVVISLGWDEERAALARRIEAGGVGTRRIALAAPGSLDAAAAGPGLVIVDPAAVERGEALEL